MGKSVSDVSKKSEKKKIKQAKLEEEDDIPVKKSKGEKKRKNEDDLEEVYVLPILFYFDHSLPFHSLTTSPSYLIFSKEPISKKSKTKEEEISSEEPEEEDGVEAGTLHSSSVPFSCVLICTSLPACPFQAILPTRGW